MLLAIPELLSLGEWTLLCCGPSALRLRTILTGVQSGRERTRLLHRGFGEVLDASLDLDELDARAERIAGQLEAIEPRRQFGPLSLDLVGRQARCRGRSLGLHPREFALLWRLADQPGQPVNQEILLRDVWHLSFRPETNSLAVHISRLRSKLRLAGLDGLVETLSTGSYRFVPDHQEPLLLNRDEMGKLLLDDHLRLGEDLPREQEDLNDADGIEA